MLIAHIFSDKKSVENYIETLIRHFWKTSIKNADSARIHLKRVSLRVILLCNSVLKITFTLPYYFSIQIPN